MGGKVGDKGEEEEEGMKKGWSEGREGEERKKVTARKGGVRGRKKE